jgi:hypothetical protein
LAFMARIPKSGFFDFGLFLGPTVAFGPQATPSMDLTIANNSLVENGLVM